MSVQEFYVWIVENYGWITFIMVALISGITEILKLPLKKLTSKIKNEKLRKLANKSIILIAFGLAFLLRYLGSLVLPKFISYEPVLSLVEGAFSNLVYAIGEGLITPLKAKEVGETIKDVSADGEISASDAKQVVDATEAKIKTDEVVKSAKSKFNSLIGKK